MLLRPARLLLLFITLTSATAWSQRLSESEWDQVIGHLVNENWQEAANDCSRHLKSFRPEDDNNDVNQLRYTYIYAIGGMVDQQKISRPKALKLVKKFLGCRLGLPSRPVKPKCIFNCIWYAEEDKDQLVTCSANKNGTFIHSFEYFRMKQMPHLETIQGKMAYVSGVLESIELQGETLSAFKLVMKDCILEHE